MKKDELFEMMASYFRQEAKVITIRHGGWVINTDKREKEVFEIVKKLEQFKLNPTKPNAFMPIHKNKNPFE